MVNLSASGEKVCISTFSAAIIFLAVSGITFRVSRNMESDNNCQENTRNSACETAMNLDRASISLLILFALTMTVTSISFLCGRPSGLFVSVQRDAAESGNGLTREIAQESERLLTTGSANV